MLRPHLTRKNPTARELASGVLLALPWLAGLVLVLTLAWLPIRVSLTHFLYEDYFYYLKVAEHIIAGDGVTFDGQARTNGFHPAWMIAITLIRALSSHTAAIHFGLTLAGVLHVAQAALLYAVIAALSRRRIAYFAAVFYLLNYRIMATNLCGLETPLAGAALLGTILFLVHHRRGLGTVRDALALGALLGLTVWTRFDLGLFVLFVGVWTLLSGALRTDVPRRERMKTTLVTSAVTAATCAATLIPWFAWSLNQSGVLLPNSRAALSVVHTKEFTSFTELVHDKIFSAAWWFGDTANALGLWPKAAPEGLFTNLSASLVVLAVLVLGLGLWKLLRKEKETFLLLSILFIYAIAHVVYYVFTLRAEFRYLLPFACVMTIVGAVLAGRLIDRTSSSKVHRLVFAVAAVLLINGLSSGMSAWKKQHGATRTHAAHEGLLDAARWLEKNVPEETTVGAWNAGVLSYFSGRQVVNLDGVINDEAIPYNRARAIDRYIAKRGIRVLADVESQIGSYMDAFGSMSEWRAAYEPKARFMEVVIIERASSAGNE